MDNFPETEAGNAFYQSSHESLNLNSISLADLPRQGPALREGRQCNNNRNMAFYSFFLKLATKSIIKTGIISELRVIQSNSRHVSCVDIPTSFAMEYRSGYFDISKAYTRRGYQDYGIHVSFVGH